MQAPVNALARMSDGERRAFLKTLSPGAAARLLYEWKFWARPNQMPPHGDWTTWLVLAGRGFGKTRMGAETVRLWACGKTPLAPSPFGYERIALVAETAADARDVMVRGDSGILASHHKDFRPVYKPSNRSLVWPNGVIATTYNGTEPDQLRGPQHHAAWCDELAKYQYAQEAWDQLQFGLRLGTSPRQIVTTTPRPIPVIKGIMADLATVVTRGKTTDNRANLASAFFRTIIAKYEGTRLGRQELDAEILDDVPGALWTRAMLDAAKVASVPQMSRVVVAVDPSGTSGEGEKADDVGIVVAGRGMDGLGYFLADRTCNLPPAGWGRRVIQAFHEFKADCVVIERNFGGAMAASVLFSVDPNVPVIEVTASRGKHVRAEPVAALYEQGRIKHLGSMPDLEDQFCGFTGSGYLGKGSPDRADAAIWAIYDLMLKGFGSGQAMFELMQQEANDRDATKAPAAAPSFAVGSVEHAIASLGAI